MRALVLRFVKYHGTGNDFLVVDRRGGGSALSPAQVVALCDRHRGVGADGVLTVWSERHGVRMQVQNADGSDTEMCGNGIRCVARFVHDTTPGAPERLVVRAGGRDCLVTRRGADRFNVDMGKADVTSPLIPSAAEHRAPFALEDSGEALQVMAVSFGNPHVVIFTEGDVRALAQRHGSSLERHPLFPARANVSFARAAGPRSFDVVVYERGAGFTLACGSAACAVAVTAVWSGRAARGAPIEVRLPGGALQVTVGEGDRVELEGEAVRVFAGEITS